MIKRSALPKGVITKLLGGTKLVRTIAGCFNMQEAVTMRDIRLPEFDTNKRINQQKVLTTTMSKSTSSWVQTFFSRLE
jgi:hypothetical protein